MKMEVDGFVNNMHNHPKVNQQQRRNDMPPITPFTELVLILAILTPVMAVMIGLAALTENTKAGRAFVLWVVSLLV